MKRVLSILCLLLLVLVEGCATSQAVGAKTLGTVYQNTTGAPITVAVSAYSDTTGSKLQALTDNSTPPTTEVAQIMVTANLTAEIFFMVLDRKYYKVTLEGTPTLVKWTEWITK